MSRKDYEAIALAIARAGRGVENGSVSCRAVLDVVINEIVAVFADDNDRFDEQRFRAACKAARK